jgi:ADP-heptose:LPS heptosyltransferase
MSRPPFSPKDAYLSLERKIDRYLGPPQVALLSRLCGREPADGGDPARILLVKLHGIGNIVLLLPVIRRIRARYPDARIDFLSFRTNAGILRGVGEIAERHFLDRGNPWRLAASIARVFPRLRRRRYDLVVDFDQFAHFSSIATLVTGAPSRIGFRNPTLRRHLAYTIPVVYLDMAHVAVTFGRLAAAAGIPEAPGIDGRLALTDADREEAAAFLDGEGIGAGERFAVLHPGSSENLKLRRWPADRFAALGDRMSEELGLRVVVSGGEDEIPLAGAVAAGMRRPAAVAAGRLSVYGFAALCARADIVVSNDTAAVHIASAAGAPVAGLYGPNTPFLYGPRGEGDLAFYHDLPCSPCLCNVTSKMSDCRRALCMEAITADSVFEGIRARLRGAGGSPGKGGSCDVRSPGAAVRFPAGTATSANRTPGG